MTVRSHKHYRISCVIGPGANSPGTQTKSRMVHAVNKEVALAAAIANLPDEMQDRVTGYQIVSIKQCACSNKEQAA